MILGFFCLFGLWLCFNLTSSFEKFKKNSKEIDFFGVVGNKNKNKNKTKKKRKENIIMNSISLCLLVGTTHFFFFSFLCSFSTTLPNSNSKSVISWHVFFQFYRWFLLVLVVSFFACFTKKEKFVLQLN